jgi:hypothetical protein
MKMKFTQLAVFLALLPYTMGRLLTNRPTVQISTFNISAVVQSMPTFLTVNISNVSPAPTSHSAPVVMIPPTTVHIGPLATVTKTQVATALVTGVVSETVTAQQSIAIYAPNATDEITITETETTNVIVPFTITEPFYTTLYDGPFTTQIPTTPTSTAEMIIPSTTSFTMIPSTTSVTVIPSTTSVAMIPSSVVVSIVPTYATTFPMSLTTMLEWTQVNPITSSNTDASTTSSSVAAPTSAGTETHMSYLILAACVVAGLVL